MRIFGVLRYGYTSAEHGKLGASHSFCTRWDGHFERQCANGSSMRGVQAVAHEPDEANTTHDEFSLTWMDIVALFDKLAVNGYVMYSASTGQIVFECTILVELE